jgi:hypothetical protein
MTIEDDFAHVLNACGAYEGFDEDNNHETAIAALSRIRLEVERLEVERLRKMFDLTRHRVLERMGVTDMGKSWSWIENKVDKRKAPINELLIELCSELMRRTGDGPRELIVPRVIFGVLLSEFSRRGYRESAIGAAIASWARVHPRVLGRS